MYIAVMYENGCKLFSIPPLKTIAEARAAGRRQFFTTRFGVREIDDDMWNTCQVLDVIRNVEPHERDPISPAD